MDDNRVYAQSYTLTMEQIAEIAQLKIWLSVSASEVVRRAVDLLYETENEKRESEAENA